MSNPDDVESEATPDPGGAGSETRSGHADGAAPPTSAAGAGDGRRAWRVTLLATLVIGLGMVWTFRALIGADPSQVVPAYAPAGEEADPRAESARRVFSYGDHRLSVWAVARNARVWLEDPLNIYEAEACAPEPASLAMGEPMLTLGLLGTPAWLLSGDPLITFNFSLLAMTLAGAVAAQLLMRQLTGRPVAALVSALLYASTSQRSRTASTPMSPTWPGPSSPSTSCSAGSSTAAGATYWRLRSPARCNSAAASTP